MQSYRGTYEPASVYFRDVLIQVLWGRDNPGHPADSDPWVWAFRIEKEPAPCAP